MACSSEGTAHCAPYRHCLRRAERSGRLGARKTAGSLGRRCCRHHQCPRRPPLSAPRRPVVQHAEQGWVRNSRRAIKKRADITLDAFLWAARVTPHPALSEWMQLCPWDSGTEAPRDCLKMLHSHCMAKEVLLHWKGTHLGRVQGCHGCARRCQLASRGGGIA